jgi:hypothetical protein
VSVGLYSGVSGLALGVGLYKSVSGLWGGASGLIDGFGGGAFSPASLFTAGEPGAWYDPSDLTTLFQDSAGTTPVTAAAQSVGLMLDKSQNGVGTNGATQVNLLTFSEQFDNAVWTKNSATVTANTTLAPNGTLTADTLTGTSTFPYASQSVSVSAGNTVSGSFSIRKTTGLANGSLPTTSIEFRSAASLAEYGVVLDTNNGVAIAASGWGTAPALNLSMQSEGDYWRVSYSSPSAPVGTTIARIYIGVSGGFLNGTRSGAVFPASSVIIWGAQLETGSTATTYQPITSSWPATMAGNHATQSTSAQRPTYGVVPATGRRNLLTFTEQFDNAVWNKQQTTITSNAAIAPDGKTTADALFEAALINFHGVAVSSTVVVASSGQTYTASFYVKANGRTKGYISTVQGSDFATFDLAAKTIAFGGNGANVTVIAQTITELSDGWFRLTITSTFSGAVNVRPALGLSNDLGLSSYLGDITKGIFIWGAQLETGSTATAYQRVVSSFDVTEAGVQSLSYVSFDGTDDGMLTGTITPGIDKVQVFAGVRPLSNPSIFGLIAETSPAADLNNGTINAGILPSSTQFFTRGTAGRTASAAVTVPSTFVHTGIGDIAADTAILRINGSQVATNAADQGTGNYLAYLLYIGRRAAGTTFPLNGQIFSMIVRFGANLSAAQITQTETWIGQRVAPTVTI